MDETLKLAKAEKLDSHLRGYKNLKDFVHSIQKPRWGNATLSFIVCLRCSPIILLITAGAAVDAAIETLQKELEEGDIISTNRESAHSIPPRVVLVVCSRWWQRVVPQHRAPPGRGC